MYKDKDNWEQVWYKLRGVSLKLFRTTRNNDSTNEALDSLCEIEEDDDMTFFENITREAFAGDRGKANGTNKSLYGQY
nr:1150_t:CDS:2 [Entrophospora candida]CAG8642890.1 2723_t:CDS:2 [Entrophospora candida]